MIQGNVIPAPNTENNRASGSGPDNQSTSKRVIYNLIFAVLSIGAVILIDTVIKKTGLNRFHLVYSYPYTNLLFFVILFIVSFIRHGRIYIIATLCVSLILFCESAYLQYFGRFIPQQLINELIPEFGEIYLELSHEYKLVVFAAIPAVLNFFLFILISRMTIKRASFPHILKLLLFFQICFSIWAFNYEDKININPQPVFLNTYLIVVHTLTMYLAYELPRSLSLLETSVKDYIEDEPDILERIMPGKRNIIFVMGESLGTDHMSVYGYERETTPFLDSKSADRDTVLMTGISASAKTSISLPHIFNMIEKPDGVKQIISDRTNLYRLAKQNGFTTHYVTSTDIDYLKTFINYIGVRYIDHFIDNYSGSNTKNVMDEVNVKYLEKVDLSGNNLVVLHMRGSHTPYQLRYTRPFARFPVDKNLSYREKRTNNYDNSVVYTDYLIQTIYNYIKANTNVPTYLVFTSDHGESLGENGIYGHVSNDIPVVIRVPVIIMGLNNADLSFIEFMRKSAFNRDIINHFEFSKLLAWMLGYDITLNSVQKEGYYVNGNRLDGSAGYIKLVINDEGDLIDENSNKIFVKKSLKGNCNGKLVCRSLP